MYSMVLMVAMSASPEAAAFGKGGCMGCDGGCYGSVASCHGCKGGGLFGGHGKGCCGGGFIGGGHGHKSGCCGGGGLFGGHGCTGSGHGCCGGGFIGGGHGHKSGCCGGGGLFGGHGHKSGCCGGGYYGGCTGGPVVGCQGCIGGGYVVPPPPVIVDPKKDMPKKDGGKGGVTQAPAYITVNVPADAKITIDGAPTTSTSSVRVFATPELTAGTVYYYTITAEVVRDGKTITASEKVAVEAGLTTQLSLSPNAGTAVASK